MNVIRHQAVGPNRQVLLLAAVFEQIEVQEVVSIFKENLLACIAALGDVVGNAFQQNTGDS